MSGSPQTHFLCVEKGKNQPMFGSMFFEVLCHGQQGGSARGIVICSIVNRIISNPEVIVMRTDDNRLFFLSWNNPQDVCTINGSGGLGNGKRLCVSWNKWLDPYLLEMIDDIR